MEKLSKLQAMSSMDSNMRGTSGSKDEYDSLGHDGYFQKYEKLNGLTKEQFEISKRNWNSDTFSKLFEKQGDAKDNF